MTKGEKLQYEAGFHKACLLICGTSHKWSTYERRLYNRATRSLFGRKRPKK